MKAGKPTLSQHAQNAQAVIDALHALMAVQTFAAETYGKTSKEARAAKAAMDRLQTYRAWMDTRVCLEHMPPGGGPEAAAGLACYYPGRQETQSDAQP